MSVSCSSPSPPSRVHRVALLFNASKVYDRELIAGIGDYVHQTRVAWDLFLEEDLRYRLEGIGDWQGDGIIADFDDPAVCAALSHMRLPVVGVGSSYEDDADYPQGIPYVATDNRRLVAQAYQHLVEAGLSEFACYSLPESPLNRWAQEREKAFAALMQRDGLACRVHRGLATSAITWNGVSRQLSAWLTSLPRPIGIMAVTDARARQLLQACILAGIAVPGEVAIVGIDNDTLGQHLTRIPLSSVSQGTADMGRTAAALMHQILGGAPLQGQRVVVPPAGVQARASSQRETPHSARVMRAQHYIRQYACQGIRTEQVAAYLGLSRSALESQFRREVQCSVHEAILQHKLLQARELLEHTDLPTAQIAQRAGFGSAQYLNTVFRREMACTPREWREQRGRQECATHADAGSVPAAMRRCG